MTTPKTTGYVMLCAGGTGGHIFPAQALAQELRRRGVPIGLITDRRGAAYATVFGAANISVIAARNPSGGLRAKLAAAFALAWGTLQSLLILGRNRPAIIVGFGGYPALPGLLAAVILRIPTVIHEQNAVLGRVNRLLAKYVHAIAASVDGLSGLGGADPAKITVTGNPVRAEIASCHAIPYTAPTDDDAVNIVVFGGSQGAQIFSDMVPAALASLPLAVQRRVRILQQCREENLAAVKEQYARTAIAAELHSFIRDMPAALASADLVIARSGATTISELTVAGRPSILVPYPHHADQQQLENARQLVQAGAAWLLEESTMTPAALAKLLQKLFRHPEQLEAAAAAARMLGRPNAAEALADMVMRRVPADARPDMLCPDGDPAGNVMERAVI